ncbi:MAG: TRL-like family protein [Candidatus Kapaibacterium sp.]
MNKLKVLIITLATAGMMASCSLTLPVAATSNPIGSKVGTATASGFFQVLFFGADASIQTAAKNAGITKISTVDIKQSSLLGILVSYETIVTGE